MDIKNLYRQIIMDHYKNPLNKGLVNNEKYLTIHMNNPSCGDDIIVQFLEDDQKIVDIRHDGTGCSICCSSASVMSSVLVNKSKEQVLDIIDNFYSMLTNNEYDNNLIKADLLAYHGVSQFPARIKCATLSWKAIEKGLLNEREFSDE